MDDARNLGFVLRTAEALGVHAVLIKKHLWDFDAVEIARPSSGAYERLPLVQFEDVSLLHRLQRRGLRVYGCIAGVKRTMYDVKLDVVSRRKAAGRRDVGEYFGNYERLADWHLVPAWLDDREVLAVVPPTGDGAPPRYFIEIAWRDGRIEAIRDWRHVAYIARDAVFRFPR